MKQFKKFDCSTVHEGIGVYNISMYIHYVHSYDIIMVRSDDNFKSIQQL